MELKGLKNAWVTPYGEYVTTHPNFYDDGAAWHNQLANKIVSDEFNSKDFFELSDTIKSHGFDYAYEYLESKGWIRLHGFGGITPKFVKIKNKLTKEQESAIVDWCIENNIKYDDCFTK